MIKAGRSRGWMAKATGGRFGLVGALLTLVMAFSGLLALDYVAPTEPAAAANTACTRTMTAQGGYTAAPSHGQVFYIDSGVSPKIDASYVGYTITNTTGSTQTFWVSLTDFIGGKVTLANPADQYQQVKDLATGQSKTVFYMLKASGATTASQTHTVKVWNKRPDLSGASAAMTCDFTFLKVSETIKASANKVGVVSSTLSPATATLGGTVAISLSTSGNNKTQTGNLGSGSTPDFAAFWASPAAYSTWPTQALRLESTSIVIECQGSGTLTLTNRLFVSDTTAPSPAGQPTLASCVSTGQGSLWTATYTFRIIGPSASTFSPSPVANIASGTQYKHTDLAGIGSNTTLDLTGVNGANAMTVELDAALDTTITSPAIPSGTTRVRYTATVTTTSTSALQVDELVDTHASLSSGGYVTGSTRKSQVNGATVVTAETSGPEPNVLASESSQSPPPQHFVGPFTGITSTSAQKLMYSFDIPCDGQPHATSIMAYVSTVGIALNATAQRTVTATAAASNCALTIVKGTVTLDPTAQTTAATSITSSAATLNGVLNASGNSGTSYRFVYSTDQTLAYATASSPSWTSIAGTPSTNTAYNLGITGLSAMTTYYFKIQIKTSSGTIFSGLTLSFTTLAQQAIPTVTTTSATKVTNSAVTLNGIFNANLTAITGVKFDLCTNSALSSGCVTGSPFTVVVDDGTGASTNLTVAANSSGDFVVNSDSITGTQTITALAGATTYFFRVYVTCTTDATYCPAGRVNGAILSFTTGAPVATTLDATNVGGTTATLNGTVNANNTTNSAVSFCYSTSNAATTGALNTCTSGTASTPTVSGQTDQAESSAITGLTSGTVYYFQVKVVTTTNITTYGSILSFTTLGITTSSPLPNGATGNPYSTSFAGIGGSNTYTWSTTSSLPTGLSLTPQGLLSGSPTTSGTYSIDVTLTDPASGLTVTKTFTVTITGNPTVSTTGATVVRFTSATINGTVSPNGTTLTGASFCWGTDSALNTCNSVSIATGGFNSMTSNSVSTAITGLTAGTTYYYKVSTTWGASSSVATTPSSFSTASVTTSDPSGVGVNGATIAGLFVAGSSALANGDVTESKICYSKSNTVTNGLLSSSVTCTPNFWTGTSTLSAAASQNNSKGLTGLDTLTQYYYQHQATFAGGAVSYGAVKTFTTMDVPTATVDSAVQVTGKSAKIRGRVNPKGNSVGQVRFCWGTDSNISIASCNQQDVGTSFITLSNSDNAAETALSNLAPGTTYYYIIYAKTNNFVSAASLRFRAATVNSKSVPFVLQQTRTNVKQAAVATSDTVYSNTSSFTTAGAVTNNATSVTYNSATLNGTLTASSSGLLNTDVKSVKLCYSTTNTLTSGVLSDAPVCSSSLWGSTVLTGAQAASFSSNVTGLTQGTQYYEQLQVVFYDDTVLNGAAVPFTTATLQVPTVQAADNISSSSATLHGTVDAKGTTLSSVKFCYDTTAAFTNCAANTVTLATPAGGWSTSINTLSTNVTGLSSSTTYYFKVLTVSNLAPVDSSYLSFKTLSVLSFDAQGGSSVQSIEYATGATVNLSGSTTTRTGYTFLGWFEAQTGGTAVSTNYAVPGTTNKVLYAQWSQDSYAVTFDEHGGSAVSDTTYVYGGTISAPATTTWAGRTFLGWFTAATGGTKYTFPYSTGTLTGPITIHAQWSLITYNVTFDERGGSAVSDTTYTIGTTISAPTPGTSLSGYQFLGWFTDPTAGTQIDFTSYPSNGTTGDIILYAHWSKITYTVYFDENGGSTVPDATYQIGGTISAPSNPTWTGHTFLGWFTQDVGGTQIDFTSYPSNGTTGDITIYAHWSLTTYNITFDERGGTATTDATYQIGGTISAPSPQTTRAGYQFDGWYTDPTAGTLVTFTSYPTTGTTGNIILYAHWTAYVVTFSTGTGGGAAPNSMTGSITLPTQGSMTAPTNSTFGGWQCPAGNATLAAGTTFNPTSNVTCTAVWILAGSKTVTFHKNFGASTETSSQSTNAPTNLTANSFVVTGYTFAYWCKVQGTTCLEANRVADMAGYAFDADLDLYAIWTINTYVITYDPNYNGSPASTNETKDYNTVIDLTAKTLSRTGYDLAGWSTSKTGSTINSLTVTETKTLYAIWTIKNYTITYYNNFGASTTTTQGYNFNDTGALNFALPGGAAWTNVGYTFLGWATTNSATTASSSYTVTGDANLYAVWQVNSYVITYNQNYGSNTTVTHSFNYGATNALTYATGLNTRTGYSFSGWSTTNNGSALTSYTVTGAETLYAVWTINTYVISYQNNFGTPTTSTQSYNYGDTTALTYALPSGANWTKEGHTFAGWATTNSATTAAGSYTVTGAASLYAVWTANSYNIIFDKNDGSVTPATTTQSFSYGATNALNYSTGFTRTGYSLAGWASTGRTGSVLSSYTVSGAATLYAKWTPASNPVIFNPQNGTANINSTYLTGGTIADPGTTPYLAGNHFLGWFDASTSGNLMSFPYAPGTVGTVTLYGQWTPWVVTFTLGAGGGAAATGTAPAPMTGVIAHLPGQGSMVAPTGYVFTGWSCPGSPTTYVAGSSITPTGDITCEAQWSLNAAKTITFHSNYPVGTNTTTVQTSSTAANLDPNPFNSGGYSFIGWSLTPSGSVAYGNRANYDFLLDGDLYAKWAQNEPNIPVYIVNFEYQGGDGSVVVTYYRFGDPGIALPTATRPGYNFTGWTTEPNNTQSVNAPFTTNQNVKLYAQWAPKQITVTFDYQGGTQGVTELSYKVGDPGLTLPTNTTKSKLYFGGWAEVPGGSDPVAEPFSPTENVTLYAIWNGTKIIVTLDPANGQPTSKLTYVIGGKPLQLPAMVNSNFNFIGWNSATNAINGVPNPYKPTRNITLYPVWQEPNASTKVIFTGDSSVLTPAAKKILQSLAKKVAQSPQHRQLVVDGWVKETLNKSYDMQLSNQRAVKTAAYLKSIGVDAFARLTPRGISPENTFESRRANVSIFYSGPKK